MNYNCYPVETGLLSSMEKEELRAMVEQLLSPLDDLVLVSFNSRGNSRHKIWQVPRSSGTE